jgi:hypothetical protein
VGNLEQGIWALRARSDNLDVLTRQDGCSIGRSVVAGPQRSQLLVECLFAWFVERSIRPVGRPVVFEKVINDVGGRKRILEWERVSRRLLMWAPFSLRKEPALALFRF